MTSTQFDSWRQRFQEFRLYSLQTMLNLLPSSTAWSFPPASIFQAIHAVLDVLASARVVPLVCALTAAMTATPAQWIHAHQVREEMVAHTVPECATTITSAPLTLAANPVVASSPTSPATMATPVPMTSASLLLVARASEGSATTTTLAPATTATPAVAASS